MQPRTPLFRSFRLQRIRKPHLTSPPSESSSTSASSEASSSSMASSSRSQNLVRPEGRYKISRTLGGELPVYSEVRNGGGWKTIVRRVEGDVHTLQTQLVDHFLSIQVDPLKQIPKITVKPTNRHLVLKGKWVEEVKSYLEERGF